MMRHAIGIYLVHDDVTLVHNNAKLREVLMVEEFHARDMVSIRSMPAQ
jgi:hypothetical protein